MDPLPIDPLLGEVRRVMREKGALLLSAPPGSGKTTRVPTALLEELPAGEIVVLEPRKLPARAAAARVAAELGCALGDLVGYQVRSDRRTSKATRIRFVTEGVLVRQLVADPFLEGVAAVVLDEFHERHAEGDLALAMLREVKETVRPDLWLCVMSATLDVGPLQQFLPDAAVLEGDGRLFDVRVEHAPRSGNEPLEVSVRKAVDRALAETPGDVLVFLPGVGEIERSAGALASLAARSGCEIHALHGRLHPAEQDLAIRTAAGRKVVLSTNVAESSLTIPGVTAVVDSGLCRELRHDRSRGVDVLELTRIGMSSAVQRSGRAGRVAAGVCYRLWGAGEERGMAARSMPELLRIDLAAPSLLIRAFAGRSPAEFGWFEAPAAAALAAADALLVMLGAVDGQGGAITDRGLELLRMPMHPRLGSVVLAGRRSGCERAAATAASLLAEVDDLGRRQDGDVERVVQSFLHTEGQASPSELARVVGLPVAAVRQVQRGRDRLLRSGGRRGAADGTGLAACLLAGFPDRVAVRVGSERKATMVGGRGLVLPDAADGQDLVLALQLRETGRQQRSTVTSFAGLDEELLEQSGSVQTRVVAQLDEANGRVFAVRQRCYRDLVLASARGGEVGAEQVQELLLPLLQRDPMRWLGEQKELRRLMARAAFLAERAPELGLPTIDSATIATAAIDLLGASTDLRRLRDARVHEMVLMHWNREQRRALDLHAPDRIELPSARSAVVDYAAEAGPTIRARMQEFFGLRSVAALASGRVAVVLELLAPNHRPVQVTTDLPSFWQNVYPQVRRELQRRYPRHSWPEDPLAAQAEARPPRRR